MTHEKELALISNTLHDTFLALAFMATADIEDPDNEDPLVKSVDLLRQALELLDSQIKHSDTFLLLKATGELQKVKIPLGNPSVFNEHIHTLINCECYELEEFGNSDKRFYFVVDELGKLYEFPRPLNTKATSLYPGVNLGDYIVGDVIIGKHGYINGEPDLVGLDDSEISYFNMVLNNVPD